MRDLGDTLSLAAHIAERYNISSVRPLLRTCLDLQQERVLRIAILGRFKAGKSSFLNHLLGRELLPVGVVPVTSVVTEIGYGPEETATVHFLDGTWEEVSVDSIRSYVTESENPENRKQVSLVEVELPALKHLRNIRFVDTPGLESVFTHNTDTSLSWLPRVGLALVAIGIDPPLSERDVALIRNLYQYTPHVSVLLTKVDGLNERELEEVEAFVNEQLKRHLNPPPRVLPYSVRSGHEDLRRRVEEELMLPAQAEFAERQHAILGRKIATLLRQCEDYLKLALRSAETLDSDRGALRQIVLGEREFLAETKLQLKLIARHAAGSTRQIIEKQLQSAGKPIEERLLPELQETYPRWAKNLGSIIASFQSWLEQSLARELRSVSTANRKAFLIPIDSAKGQLTRPLEDFQRRLSERTTRAFGVPLRVTEIDIGVEDPRTPDIGIGRVFDHNWELLGFLVPMWLVRGWVERHLLNSRLPYETFKNLSRLTSQWVENVNDSIFAVEKQSELRLDELMATVDSLLSRSSLEAPRIRSDLKRVEAALASMPG
jgi:GTP-binding protein EngB required for normal cell division